MLRPGSTMPYSNGLPRVQTATHGTLAFSSSAALNALELALVTGDENATHEENVARLKEALKRTALKYGTCMSHGRSRWRCPLRYH